MSEKSTLPEYFNSVCNQIIWVLKAETLDDFTNAVKAVKDLVIREVRARNILLIA